MLIMQLFRRRQKICPGQIGRLKIIKDNVVVSKKTLIITATKPGNTVTNHRTAINEKKIDRRYQNKKRIDMSESN